MKEIVINNKEKFYKRLHFYRSFLYKKTIFKTDIKDEELKDIVKALNIKKRRERIEFIYDNCCERADRFNKENNICGFENGECIFHRSINSNFKNGCCSLCRYQSSTGCQTANLSCKLFYCNYVKKNCKIMKPKELKILKLLGFRQKVIALYNFFSKREQIIFEIYIGSMVFYLVRVIPRIFLNLRKPNKK